MARADLLLSLVRAGAKGDTTLWSRALQALIAEERGKQHGVLAARLEEFLVNGVPKGGLAPNGIPDERLATLITELTPRRSLDDLIVPDDVRTAFAELVEEHSRRALLASYGLVPRNRVLLVGPPGNGKTSLAHALAGALAIPLYFVRYEGTIGSYLGETAARLGRVFGYVRTRPCVLFFDEFDTLGKERGDEHETGEIKRVVSSLLLQIDDLPSHVVVVTATNHDELLDRAVWRRFQIRLHLPRPRTADVAAWIERFEIRIGSPLGVDRARIVEGLKGASFAEIEDFGADVQRRNILALPDSRLDAIVRRELERFGRRRNKAQRED